MKWIFIIVGGLALLVAVMAIVGATLPRDHHITRKARFHVAPEVLFAVVSGPPDWRTGIKSFGELPDEGGRKRWWEEDTHRQKITYELVSSEPPRRMATRIAQPGLPFGGGWTFEVTPLDAGGSELRIQEDGEIYNVIFRFMARYLFGYTGTIETYLKDLGAKFREPVVIEG